jgi:hypothetical protein
MTSYLAHHTKKKRILARKEAALRRLVSANAPVAKLVTAAETVRDARIRVLRVQRSLIVPAGDAADVYSRIDSEIERVSKMCATTVLAEFGYTSKG